MAVDARHDGQVDTSGRAKPLRELLPGQLGRGGHNLPPVRHNSRQVHLGNRLLRHIRHRDILVHLLGSPGVRLAEGASANQRRGEGLHPQEPGSPRPPGQEEGQGALEGYFGIRALLGHHTGSLGRSLGIHDLHDPGALVLQLRAGLEHKCGKYCKISIIRS